MIITAVQCLQHCRDVAPWWLITSCFIPSIKWVYVMFYFAQRKNATCANFNLTQFHLCKKKDVFKIKCATLAYSTWRLKPISTIYKDIRRASASQSVGCLPPVDSEGRQKVYSKCSISQVNLKLFRNMYLHKTVLSELIDDVQSDRMRSNDAEETLLTGK